MGHKFAESFLVASVETEIVIMDSNPVKHKTNELIRQSATIVGIEKMFAQSLFCKFINLMKWRTCFGSAEIATGKNQS